ncbi:MAG: hypothetical protein A3G35_19275 [candidate division NC10 bacterium RIFCSPLOWO2_12_FULL_66_18]|nr:MAG: hypothetical protein A3H39_07310 [candidate division NC10 bacterium RIFCSPLOWO2_02_FULL_66_22]OGB99871.1 MAG: hypothetical protein A3G35_19275 [candidate division NC10 bacterium RIFCSPLOWO2_12_FULL_66_18]
MGLIETRNLGDQVYEMLRERFRSGNLAPGTKLHEPDLAQELGVSRTPVREAIQRLQREGLVRISPHRGAFVVNLAWRDLEDLCDVREGLEGIAARLAATRISEEELDRVEAGLKQREQALTDPSREPERPAVDFHDAILRASGNERLIREMGTIQDLLGMIRTDSAAVAGRASKSLAEHWKILRALRARDPDTAERGMRAHIRTAKENILRHLVGQPSSPR